MMSLKFDEIIWIFRPIMKFLLLWKKIGNFEFEHPSTDEMLSYNTLMDEVSSVVIEKYEFEYRMSPK